MGKRLPVPVKQVLREPFDDRELAALVRRAHAPRARARRRLVAFAAAAALGAALVMLLARGAGGGDGRAASVVGPLRLEDGASMPAVLGGGGAARFTFEDGSVIGVGGATRLRRLQNDDRDLVLLLESGEALFDVRPGGARRWTIECGLATVVVVGTRFTIERTSASVRVEVERGAVLVRGERVPQRAQRLEAGDRIVVEAPRAVRSEPRREEEVPGEAMHAEPPEPAPVPTTAARDEMPAANGAGARATPLRRNAVRRSWREAAERGAWDEAYAVVGGRMEQVCERASTDDLLLLADVARLSGHPEDAITPLERVVRDASTDPRAPLAAFTLGRIALDLGQPARAERAFVAALALDLPDALRANALARLAEVRLDTRDFEGARAVAAQYLVEYPEGREVEAMRRLVSTE